MGKGEILKPPKAEIATSHRLGHVGEKVTVLPPTLCARVPSNVCQLVLAPRASLLPAWC